MLLLNDGWKPMKYYSRDTGDIMEDSDIEIRVDGKFRRSDTKKLISINMKSKLLDEYPIVDIMINGYRHIYRAHIAILATFGDNKGVAGTKNLYVDHVDRNRKNFSLDNLRFVTPSQNNFNKGDMTHKYYYIIYSTLTKSITAEIQKTKDINLSSVKKMIKESESICIFSKDLYFKIKDQNINNPIEYLESLVWICVNSTFSISNMGILKIEYTKVCTFTLGSLEKGYYRTTLTGNIKKSIHRIVAEKFLNGGKEIAKGLVVDHINTNTLDNSVNNLRIVTQRQNLNNELTRQRFMKPIKCKYKDTTILYFRGVSECAKIIGRKQSSVLGWVIGKYRCTIKELSEFQYVSQDDSLDNIKFTESIEDLNLSLLSPKDIKTYDDMEDFINTRKLSSRKDFIISGLESFYNSFVHRFHPIKYYKK